MRPAHRYVAPDPVAPADGSVQLGSQTWPILADRDDLPGRRRRPAGERNNGPTCLAMDLDDDGNATAVDFSPTGTLSGDVDFDTDSGFYFFADRLIIPPFVTDANPGLAALVVTSEQAGTPLTITFTVDTTTGGFTGFDGNAAFCGKGSLTSGGDGKVGNAVIPGSVLDAADRTALENAGSRQTCAAVHAVGVIDSQGNIAITTTVTITVAAAGVTITPPPTSTECIGPREPCPHSTAISWLVVVLATALAIVTLHVRRRTEARRGTDRFELPPGRRTIRSQPNSQATRRTVDLSSHPTDEARAMTDLMDRPFLYQEPRTTSPTRPTAGSSTTSAPSTAGASPAARLRRDLGRHVRDRRLFARRQRVAVLECERHRRRQRRGRQLCRHPRGDGRPVPGRWVERPRCAQPERHRPPGHPLELRLVHHHRGGRPLKIQLTIQDAADCAPIAGAAVYLWHCDRDGNYSLYSQGVTDENYLRGVQEADANGVVTFQSIFPACYPGRWPHAHFEVFPSLDMATNENNRIATSQIALPKDICEEVYATAGYAQSVQTLSQLSLASDMVFSDDGAAQQLGTMSGSVADGLQVALVVPVGA